MFTCCSLSADVGAAATANRRHVLASVPNRLRGRGGDEEGEPFGRPTVLFLVSYVDLLRHRIQQSAELQRQAVQT